MHAGLPDKPCQNPCTQCPGAASPLPLSVPDHSYGPKPNTAVAMITVSCASCGAKLFRYQKIGKGRLLHCWKTRISSDHTRQEGGAIFCPKCGQHIGVVETQWINMHGGSFTVKGSALKK